MPDVVDAVISALPKAYRIATHDPSTPKGPAADCIRVILSVQLPHEEKEPLKYQDEEIMDVELKECPLVIERLLGLGAFEHARNFANAWFVGLAHKYGHKHVALT